MNNAMSTGQAINVSPDQATVCCRGDSKALGHPAVYLTFTDQATVQCYYCGCKYKHGTSDGVNLPEAG